MSEARAALQERLRLKTLAQYLAPGNITPDKTRSSHGRPPKLSQSIQLTAITQNGALRLQCDRAFVSLISSDTQFIISEATRSISLRNANQHAIPQDALFLGCQALDKDYGICPNSIAIFTDSTGDRAIESSGVVANTEKYVIRDLRDLEHFKHRPYVVGFPHMRSYVEVPVKSSDGQVIGTYCAMDNKVRDDFFSDETIGVLTEIAECITEHLDMQVVKQNYARGERLMEGLSEFTRGRSYSDKEENARTNVKTPGSASKVSAGNSAGYFPDHFNVDQSPSMATSSERSSSVTSSYEHPLSGAHTYSTPLTTPSEGPDSGPTSSSSLASYNHPNPRSNPSDNSVFSNAAILIRETIDLEGLVFLDASNRSASQDTSLVCEVLGSALASKECALGPSNTPLVLHESTLGYLAKNYPHGCSFTTDGYGFLLPNGRKVNNTRDSFQDLSDVWQDVPQELQELAVKARSVIFLPLWDYSNEKFFVGMVGWSTDPTRVFHEQDLTCLSAFGNAMMNEVARSEAVDIACAKSDFMSSISHELRSPLHGILASVEFLQELVADDSQSDMINMIQSCGSTLLDTLNHLLDFSKINEFADAKSHVRKLSKAQQKAPESAFGEPTVQYLCRLVQDVVDGVHFGQTSQQAAIRGDAASAITRRRNPADPAVLIDSTHSTGPTAPKHATEVVGVFVDTENRADWCMSLSAGAWKRIVMNLFANSLKYTRQGQIEVSLKMIADPKNKGSGGQVAQLTFKDTGIGMSEDYIKYHLYKPFVQENPLANGTGLGLSIVKQIIGDLGGTIDVESTPGAGTRFDVCIPISEPAIENGKAPVSGGQLVDPLGKLKGLTICLLAIPEKETITESSSARRRTETMHSYIRKVAKEWFETTVITAQSPEDIEADFFLLEAHHLERIFPSKGARSTNRNKQRILVVDGLSFGESGKYKLFGNTTRLTYPISPKMLGRTLLSSLKAPMNQVLDIEISRESGVAIAPSRVPAASTNYSSEVPQIPKRVNPTLLNPVEVSAKNEHPPKHHLLLVDDNAINLKILCTYVAKLGLTAQSAENGLEAYEHYKATKKPFTMVLMDISMPVMDGFASARAIREYEVSNALQPTRIVALTGLGSEASRQEAALSGIDDFKTKPVALKVLKELLT